MALDSIAVVEARQVVKLFNGVEILKGVDLRIESGEVVCLIGPSGSGKSTFLRCINHLEKIDGGSLQVFGEWIGYRQVGDKLHILKESEIVRKRAHRHGVSALQFVRSYDGAGKRD